MDTLTAQESSPDKTSRRGRRYVIPLVLGVILVAIAGTIATITLSRHEPLPTSQSWPLCDSKALKVTALFGHGGVDIRGTRVVGDLVTYNATNDSQSSCMIVRAPTVALLTASGARASVPQTPNLPGKPLTLAPQDKVQSFVVWTGIECSGLAGHFGMEMLQPVPISYPASLAQLTPPPCSDATGSMTLSSTRLVATPWERLPGTTN